MLPEASPRLVFLLGYPVEHSLSPWLHNRAFRHQGLPYVYVAAPVLPEHLADAVRGLKTLSVVGANVTIPHKSTILPLLDSVSPEVARIGAANTLVLRHQGERTELRGENTDIEGFSRPLQPYAERLENAPVTVFGAGGAARAVVYALLTAFSPSRITLVVRSPQRAEALLQDFTALASSVSLEVRPLAEAAPAVREATLVVNTTPVGMYPQITETIWPEAEDFHKGQIVYDLVYNPLHTRLLQTATSQGAIPISGLDMLIEQAAAAYRLWTRQPFPHSAIREALTIRLRKTI